MELREIVAAASRRCMERHNAIANWKWYQLLKSGFIRG
jgi:hypothetical protein